MLGVLPMNPSHLSTGGLRGAKLLFKASTLLTSLMQQMDHTVSTREPDITKICK